MLLLLLLGCVGDCRDVDVDYCCHVKKNEFVDVNLNDCAVHHIHIVFPPWDCISNHQHFVNFPIGVHRIHCRRRGGGVGGDAGVVYE